MRNVIFVLLVALVPGLGCPDPVVESYELDCADLDLLVVGQTATLFVTYFNDEPDQVISFRAADDLAVFDPVSFPLADTGSVRPFRQTVSVTPRPLAFQRPVNITMLVNDRAKDECAPRFVPAPGS